MKAEPTPYKDKLGNVIYSGELIEFDDFDIGSETHFRNTGMIIRDLSGIWYIPSANTIEMDELKYSNVIKLKNLEND